MVVNSIFQLLYTKCSLLVVTLVSFGMIIVSFPTALVRLPHRGNAHVHITVSKQELYNYSSN